MLEGKKIAIVGLLALAPWAGASPEGAVESTEAAAAAAAAPAAGELDPHAFFDSLVERYRSLRHYEDQVHLTQTIVQEGRDEGTEARRQEGDAGAGHTVETDICCRVEGDALHVSTPVRQASRPLRFLSSLVSSPAFTRLKQRYDLWLAPHLTLRVVEQPLREFREGVEGFVASAAEHVVVDERPMVHLTLRSAPRDGDAADARFDLYVNCRSMLIERIEGEQPMPGGASMRTTLEITPLAFSGEGSPETPREPTFQAPVEPTAHAPLEPTILAPLPGPPPLS